MNKDRAADRSRQSDATDATKPEEILSTPANKSTAARLRIFLDSYAKTGRVHRACAIAHITPKTHYRRFEVDGVYRAAFQKAEQQVGQLLEDTAVERALDGDNHLLLALLKRFRPEAYRERTSVEHSGSIDLVQIIEAQQRVVRMRERDAGNAGSGAA